MRSIRSRYSSTTSTGETARSRMSRACSSAGRKAVDTCLARPRRGVASEQPGEGRVLTELGGPSRCDRRGVLEPFLRDALRRACGVVLGADSDLERTEELLALRDRLRVRDQVP